MFTAICQTVTLQCRSLCSVHLYQTAHLAAVVPLSLQYNRTALLQMDSLIPIAIYVHQSAALECSPDVNSSDTTTL
jgi:hypothetical protein